MSTSEPVRLLIVDDEPAHLKALCDTLQEHGYSTVGFTTGTAALAALREAKFDLLLSDLMMPEMDGLALLRAAVQTDPDLAGVIMTGQGSIDTAVEAMKSGALDYILKPFRLRIALPVISRALAVRQLRLKNAQLERDVRQRSAELEAANRDLDAFSHSVSHDLRAPLRTISGYSDILIEDFSAQIPAEAHVLLNRIVTGARKMGQLIDDLLRLSRLGRQSLSKEPVNVASLVHEILEELRRDQGDRHVEVQVGILLDCIGDRALLRQVFVNLLSNAFKFTRQKEKGRIELGCLQQEGTVFFVRDNGVGFDKQFAGRLFRVFERLHRPEEFEGTGIGLSIVRRIIDRHGGRVWAEAAVDQGATFYFSLAG